MKFVNLSPAKKQNVNIPSYSPFGEMDIVGNSDVAIDIYQDENATVECSLNQHRSVEYFFRKVRPFKITKEGLFEEKGELDPNESYIWIKTSATGGYLPSSIENNPLLAAAYEWALPEKPTSYAPISWGKVRNEGWAYRDYEGEGIGRTAYVKAWEYCNTNTFRPVLGSITSEEVEALKQQVRDSEDTIYIIVLSDNRPRYGILQKS